MHHRVVQIQKALRLSGNATFRRGLRFGVAAAVEHTAMMRSLDIATLVDIGANVGQFTLLAIAIKPDITVEAFEPLAGPAAVFRRLFAGNQRVILHQVAIGPAEAVATMNVSRRDDSSSLLPITRLQTESFPGTDKIRVEEVRVATLESELSDDRIREPALLKLDVQGYELQALRGSLSMLHRFRHIYSEVSFAELYEGQSMAHEVIAFLAAAGFALVGIYNTQHDRNDMPIQCDCLFTRVESGQV
jgi:FkbM family methyltransferase